MRSGHILCIEPYGSVGTIEDENGQDIHFQFTQPTMFEVGQQVYFEISMVDSSLQAVMVQSVPAMMELSAEGNTIQHFF